MQRVDCRGQAIPEGAEARPIARKGGIHPVLLGAQLAPRDGYRLPGASHHDGERPARSEGERLGLLPLYQGDSADAYDQVAALLSADRDAGLLG